MNAPPEMLALVPALPCDAEGPVFREPWEAQAFALAIDAHARGLFSWPEWAAALSAQIKAAQAAGDPDTGETYYRHWLAALEALTVQKGAATKAQLQQVQAAWDHAAKATPHGQPVVLAGDALQGVGL
jgi:nitrile hydratase accessory protein